MDTCMSFGAIQLVQASRSDHYVRTSKHVARCIRNGADPRPNTSHSPVLDEGKKDPELRTPGKLMHQLLQVQIHVYSVSIAQGLPVTLC